MTKAQLSNDFQFVNSQLKEKERKQSNLEKKLENLSKLILHGHNNNNHALNIDPK
eukprot:Pgem_evm1s15852